MKKNISFIILIAWGIILIFAGCKGISSASVSDFDSAPNLSSLTSAQMESATSEFSSSSEGTKAENSDPYMIREKDLTENVLTRLDNETPYDELITKEIDIHEFLSKYTGATGYAARPSMGDFDKDFTIECIRKNDADYLYSVHKVKQGGLLYLFYGTSEDYIQYSWHYYYVVKPVSKAEFNTIKIGSAIEEVEAIDPATTILKQHIIDYIEKNPTYDLRNGIGTNHYLTDGSYTINYKMEDEKLIVEDMYFYPYNYDEIEDYGFARTDWHILPQDYLPASG